MNAFKKHINHTQCINSQLVSNDSTWPLAAFVASPGTSGSSPSPQQSGLQPTHEHKYHSHASVQRDTDTTSSLKLRSPVTLHCLVAKPGLALTPAPAFGGFWVSDGGHQAAQRESPGGGEKSGPWQILLSSLQQNT